jgi:hypothetical protein
MNLRALLSCLVTGVMALPLHGAAPEFKRGEKASVLIFSTTDCPVANAMLPEIERIQRDFTAMGVAFTLVHVDPDTTEAKAREHAKAYGINFPYVLDPKHELVKRYKATRTPEAFVILPDGSTAYHGRINDLYHAPGQRRRSPSTHDLRDALASVVAGKPVLTPQQPAIGCVIADFAR